jgi:putative transposase
MKKKHVVVLSALDRAELCTVARSGRASARKVLRAKILLKADGRGENCTDVEIAESLAVGVATVERVRASWARGGKAALDRRPQPARPQKRTLDGAGEAKLVMLACSRPPDGHERWTLELLGGRMVQLKHVETISRDTVRRTLKKTNSSPG